MPVLDGFQGMNQRMGQQEPEQKKPYIGRALHLGFLRYRRSITWYLILDYPFPSIDNLCYHTGNSTPEWELHYTYDENGNRLSVSDGVGELWSVNAAQSAYGTARYGAACYTGGLDAMDRPRGISKGATLHAQFRYDSEGRRKRAFGKLAWLVGRGGGMIGPRMEVDYGEVLRTRIGSSRGGAG